MYVCMYVYEVQTISFQTYAPQKLMLDSCKMVKKQSEAFHTFLWHIFQV